MYIRFNKFILKKIYDSVVVCCLYFILVIINIFIDMLMYILLICEFVFFFIIWKGIFVIRFLK